MFKKTLFLKKINKLILLLDRGVNLYLYYIVVACFLSLVPNINPNYPLFKFIFYSTGFYLLPPFLGFSFSPMILMIILVLLSIGLNKISARLVNDEPPVIYITADEFIKGMEKLNVENSEDLENNSNTEENKSENKEDK